MQVYHVKKWKLLSPVQLCDPMDCSPQDYLWDSPGSNTRVGCHFLLQAIFPTQGLNLGLLHCWQILYHLSHQGNPKEYNSIWLLSQSVSKCLILRNHTILSDIHMQNMHNGFILETDVLLTLNIQSIFLCCIYK